MRILIVNPNSDPVMTAAIQGTAEGFASGQFEVACLPTPGAPPFIQAYQDQIQAAPGMLGLVREHEGDWDAFVVACHSDPHLDALREVTRRPVVGIGEASLRLASMLGHRFSVLVTDPRSVPAKEDLLRKYHLETSCVSVRPAGPPGHDQEERYLAAGRAAIEQDGAEVIVLGCAGLTGLDRRLQARLGAPVLDGVVCALIVASGLVRHGIAHSRLRRWSPQG